MIIITSILAHEKGRERRGTCAVETESVSGDDTRDGGRLQRAPAARRAAEISNDNLQGLFYLHIVSQTVRDVLLLQIFSLTFQFLQAAFNGCICVVLQSHTQPHTHTLKARRRPAMKSPATNNVLVWPSGEIWAYNDDDVSWSVSSTVKVWLRHKNHLNICLKHVKILCFESDMVCPQNNEMI